MGNPSSRAWRDMRKHPAKILRGDLVGCYPRCIATRSTADDGCRTIGPPLRNAIARAVDRHPVFKPRHRIAEHPRYDGIHRNEVVSNVIAGEAGCPDHIDGLKLDLLHDRIRLRPRRGLTDITEGDTAEHCRIDDVAIGDRWRRVLAQGRILGLNAVGHRDRSRR